MKDTVSVCVACGSSQLKRRVVSRSYGRNESDLMIIDDLPIDTCASCGESYISAKTLKKIEDLKKRRSKLALMAIPVGHVSSEK